MYTIDHKELNPCVLFVLLQVEEVVDGLRLDADTVLRVRGVFEEEMERGRQDQPSSLQMENTFVPELIDGTGQHHLLSYQI